MVGVQDNFLQEFHGIADSAWEQMLYALYLVSASVSRSRAD